MARATAIKHGDRIRRTSDDQAGTVVDLHDKAARLGVLPDTGPRALVVWERADIERTGSAVRTCRRCAARGHTALACTAGDL